MAKEGSGSGKDIYGANPDGKVDSIVKDALGSLGESKSNKINGPIGNKGEWSEMGEGEGEN